MCGKNLETQWLPLIRLTASLNFSLRVIRSQAFSSLLHKLLMSLYTASTIRYGWERRGGGGVGGDGGGSCMVCRIRCHLGELNSYLVDRPESTQIGPR